MALQLFLLFLSYQDPIQLDFAQVETALFNVKMASDLAVSQIDKIKPIFCDWTLMFGFLFFTTTWTLEHRRWLYSGLVEK